MSTADGLLDAAERMIREGGYHGFSFRDLAVAVGIRSASVHHHFPTKAALVVALAERCADRFMDTVAGSAPGPARLAAYRAAFRQSLGGGGMCLFGVLGAEAGGLPVPVVDAAGRFFRRAIAHLAEGLGETPAEGERRALAELARIEGAIILARTLRDPELYDVAAESSGVTGLV